MPVRIVQSKQNARLKLLRRALAQPGREPGAPFALEGPNLLAEALRAGLYIDTIFAAQSSAHLIESLPLPSSTEILLVPRELLSAALSTESPQPIAALIAPPSWQWDDLHPKDRPALLLVLAALQDPGNLGTILRSAEAFGATGIVCLPGTVSPWNPKAVRASAGSLFRIPLIESTADACFAHLSAEHIPLWTTAVANAAPIHHANLAAPAAILIGNEGNGVPPALAARAHAALTIPCPGPVESLNAAVAASILLYEASRQRTPNGAAR